MFFLVVGAASNAVVVVGVGAVVLVDIVVAVRYRCCCFVELTSIVLGQSTVARTSKPATATFENSRNGSVDGIARRMERE